MELVDNSFYVYKQRWGTWKTADRDGQSLITSMSREQAISATHFYLRGLREGWGTEEPAHSGTVEGKL